MNIIKNIIGFGGAFIFLLAYFLNTNEILSINNIEYHLLNFIGAILLGYRVLLDRNYSNFILEVFFAIIAITKIMHILGVN